MTTVELLEALARECPNGVSFDPMSVRLLLKKVPLDDQIIEDLKAAMFQLESRLFYSREMILNKESQLAFDEQVTGWLNVHGCFSVARLFEDFSNVFRHLAAPAACAAFLQYLGYTVTAWEKGGLLCYRLPPKLENTLAGVAETIVDWIEERGGTLTFNEIEQALPHLSIEALESIRIHFLPEVYRVEIGEVPCWRSAESITLPEDFPEKLTTIIDTLVALEEKVTPAKLEFSLNLFYKIRFRNEYALQNNDIFMRVCAKKYQGSIDFFPKNTNLIVKSNELKITSKRKRSPNTQFNNINVPIGAILVFTKDINITCVVIDNINKVIYKDKEWIISTLAIHLLGVSSVNGFFYFSYEGETLWERRLRFNYTSRQ